MARSPAEEYGMDDDDHSDLPWYIKPYMQLVLIDVKDGVHPNKPVTSIKTSTTQWYFLVFFFSLLCVCVCFCYHIFSFVSN